MPFDIDVCITSRMVDDIFRLPGDIFRLLVPGDIFRLPGDIFRLPGYIFRLLVPGDIFRLNYV